MKLILMCIALLLPPAASAIEITPSPSSCSSSEMRAGKVLWVQIDKAADGSVVKLTNSENHALWCYSDSKDASQRADAALKVSLQVAPDPDADHDGVPDARDKCPKTRTGPAPTDTSARPVDADGCELK